LTEATTLPIVDDSFKAGITTRQLFFSLTVFTGRVASRGRDVITLKTLVRRMFIGKGHSLSQLSEMNDESAIYARPIMAVG